jgi:hypothetical protein
MARQVHDYFAVAVAIATRFHRPLLVRFHEDVIQECHLLAWEAQVRRYVTVKNGTKTSAMATAGVLVSRRLRERAMQSSM